MSNNKDLISKAKKFYENKNFYEAKKYLLEALKDSQIDNVIRLSLYVLIADISYKINDFDNAQKYLMQSIDQGKSNTETYNFLGNIYLKKRDYKNSEKSYLKSIQLNKENETAIINLAILYHNLGNEEKAKNFYKKVLEVNPANMGALYNLSNLDKSVIDKKKIEFLKNSIDKKDLNNFNLASSYFLLANEEKNKKNFESELDLLEKANQLSFKSNERKNIQFNEYWLNKIPKKFNKLNFTINKKISEKTKNIFPIFIIGLPRCGSTLIESIISSGEENVDNFGETNLVNWSFLNTNKDFLKSSKGNQVIEVDLNETSKKLINAIQSLGSKVNDKKTFFSEKSLENFYYVELILNIYPNAKFINPQRNLFDNIFAIYKQFLPSISWSHSINDILLYIDNYQFIINYFKQKYPEKILSISLKDLTTNPMKLSKEIYKFCNLKWDEKCLDFYKRSDLFINTASNNQIRDNIKKYDNKKYEPYKQILKIHLKKYHWLKY